MVWQRNRHHHRGSNNLPVRTSCMFWPDLKGFHINLLLLYSKVFIDMIQYFRQIIQILNQVFIYLFFKSESTVNCTFDF